MLRRPRGSTRTDTLFPDTTLFRSEWLVAGCRLVLLALVASAIAGGMPNAELIPAQLQATLGQDDGASSISADGQALLVNGGPGDTVRSEARRVGEEGVSTGRTRWSPDQ